MPASERTEILKQAFRIPIGHDGQEVILYVAQGTVISGSDWLNKLAYRDVISPDSPTKDQCFKTLAMLGSKGFKTTNSQSLAQLMRERDNCPIRSLVPLDSYTSVTTRTCNALNRGIFESPYNKRRRILDLEELVKTDDESLRKYIGLGKIGFSYAQTLRTLACYQLQEQPVTTN